MLCRLVRNAALAVHLTASGKAGSVHLGERDGSGEAVDHDMDHLGDTDPVIKLPVGSKRLGPKEGQGYGRDPANGTALSFHVALLSR